MDKPAFRFCNAKLLPTLLCLAFTIVTATAEADAERTRGPIYLAQDDLEPDIDDELDEEPARKGKKGKHSRFRKEEGPLPLNSNVDELNRQYYEDEPEPEGEPIEPEEDESDSSESAGLFRAKNFLARKHYISPLGGYRLYNYDYKGVFNKTPVGISQSFYFPMYGAALAIRILHISSLNTLFILDGTGNYGQTYYNLGLSRGSLNSIQLQIFDLEGRGKLRFVFGELLRHYIEFFGGYSYFSHQTNGDNLAKALQGKQLPPLIGIFGAMTLSGVTAGGNLALGFGEDVVLRLGGSYLVVPRFTEAIPTLSGQAPNVQSFSGSGELFYRLADFLGVSLGGSYSQTAISFKAPSALAGTIRSNVSQGKLNLTNIAPFIAASLIL